MDFKNSFSHHEYINFVKSNIIELLNAGKIKAIIYYAPLIVKLFLTDLNHVRGILKSYYADKPRGEIPRDPVSMIRSLILMKLVGIYSITKWVKKLDSRPVYAILSGFDPNDVPGIGTFYDFMNRIATLNDDEYQKQKNKLRDFKQKPRKKLKKNQIRIYMKLLFFAFKSHWTGFGSSI